MPLNIDHLLKPTTPRREPPEGIHFARIVGHHHTGDNAGGSTKPAHVVDLEITDGPARGLRFIHNLWLTPKALPYTIAWLGPFGVARPEHLQPNQLAGHHVRIDVRREFSDWRRKTYTIVRVIEVLDSPDRPRPRPVRGTAWNPPAGRYTMKLIRTTPLNGYAGTRPYIRWVMLHLEVVDGPYAGYGIRPQVDIPRDQRQSPLPNHLRALGARKLWDLHRNPPVRRLFDIEVTYRQRALSPEPRPIIHVLGRVAR